MARSLIVQDPFSLTDERIMKAKTGQLMVETTIISCAKCGQALRMREGETIPKCPSCRGRTFVPRAKNQPKKSVSVRKHTSRL